MGKRGFTLIELVVVMVILGILAAVAIPKFVNLTTEAKVASTKGLLGGVRSAISIDYARYAAQNNGNTAWPTAANLPGLLQGGVPQNPYTNSSAITAKTSRVTGADAGWYYNAGEGDFWAPQDTSW